MNAKIIIGFPNYTISESGEIKNIKTGLILKQTKDNKGGYFRIGLCNNGITKMFQVHRLIYQAFNLNIGEIMPKNIDHKDGNVINNTLDNLRAASKSENGMNRKIHTNNTLGHKNIHITPYGNFRVLIKKKNCKTYSRTHKSLELAIVDATQVRNELFGIFARHS